MRPLLTNGHVFAGIPPLYRVTLPDASSVYLPDDKALDKFRSTHQNVKYEVGRFKGLGEMQADQLRETVLDPATRTLRRLTIEDAALAARSFETMMGKATEPRKKFINEHALSVGTLIETV
jgi:topoisomerase-4 subunit B